MLPAESPRPTQQDVSSGIKSTASQTDICVEEVRPESRQQSNAGAQTTDAPHFGIYLRSPITMVAVYLLGVGFAVGLHGQYSRLNGSRAGDAAEQQMALRYHQMLTMIFGFCE